MVIVLRTICAGVNAVVVASTGLLSFLVFSEGAGSYPGFALVLKLLCCVSMLIATLLLLSRGSRKWAVVNLLLSLVMLACTSYLIEGEPSIHSKGPNTYIPGPRDAK